MTTATQTLNLVDGKAAVVAHPYRVLGSFRLLLAMLVLVSHTSSYLHPVLPPLELGNIGVFLFFIVSGFVISEACDVFYRGRIANFLLNRALKIYPAYWAAIIIAYVVLLSVDPAKLDPKMPHVTLAPWPLLVNATLLLAYLKQGNNLVIITTTWAVIVEFQFYFAAAFLFFIAPRFRNPGIVLVSAAVVALALYVFVWDTGGQLRFYGGLIHAPYFVLGSAFYFLITRRNAALWPLVIIAFLLSLNAYLAYNQPGAFGAPPWHWPNGGIPSHVVAATGVFLICIALFVTLSQLRMGAGVERIDKRLGDLTYAIYLVHQPFNILAYTMRLDGLPAFFFVLTLSFVSALLIRRFIERPAMSLRNRLRGVRLYD
jgi:peptidoglycan/LPS O-acetylase OafA/YrhL